MQGGNVHECHPVPPQRSKVVHFGSGHEDSAILTIPLGDAPCLHHKQHNSRRLGSFDEPPVDAIIPGVGKGRVFLRTLSHASEEDEHRRLAEEALSPLQGRVDRIVCPIGNMQGFKQPWTADQKPGSAALEVESVRALTAARAWHSL
jgi:hypothetical protein